MRNRALVIEAFNTYNRKMNRVFYELNSLKESYSFRDSQLLMEGFWDKLKAAASGAGSFLGKATQKVANFSKDVYDKGIELGKKAIDIGKELVNKVGEVAKSAIDAIKSAPGKLWDACKDLYSSVSNEVGEIMKKAKEKGEEWVKQAKQTITEIYTKISTSMSEGIKTFNEWAQKNADAAKKMVEEKKAELIEAAKMAKESTDATIKQIAEGITSFYEKGKEVAKNTALFSLGLVLLPFYGAVKLAQKTYELGEDVTQMIANGVENIKKNVPEVWKAFTDGFKAGMDSEKKAPEAQKEGYVIKSFERFNWKY